MSGGRAARGKRAAEMPTGKSSAGTRSAVVLYGLATCDTTRAARKWLEAKGVGYSFHDVRADGLRQPLVGRWVRALGWEKVINKASTTWRGLPEADRNGLDETKAVALLLAHPALVKRPVLDRGGELSLGFKPSAYAATFG